MGAQAGLLRAGPTAERARATRVAADRVAPGRTRFEPKRGRAADEDLVFRRDRRGLGDGQLGRDRRVVGIALRRIEAGDPVGASPAGPDGIGRGDRRHPVDGRAAADARPGEDRDRPVGGRGEAVVEVQPVECVDLRSGHLRLGHQRSRPRARRPTDRPRPGPWPRPHRPHRSPRSPRRPRARSASADRQPAVVRTGGSASGTRSGRGRRGRSPSRRGAGSARRRRPGRRRPGTSAGGRTPGRPTGASASRDRPQPSR